MTQSDEESYCMNLRGISGWAADKLYNLKAQSAEPLYEWVNRMVAYYVEYHPSMLEERLEEAQLLTAEYGDSDETP